MQEVALVQGLVNQGNPVLAQKVVLPRLRPDQDLVPVVAPGKDLGQGPDQRADHDLVPALEDLDLVQEGQDPDLVPDPENQDLVQGVDPGGPGLALVHVPVHGQVPEDHGLGLENQGLAQGAAVDQPGQEVDQDLNHDPEAGLHQKVALPSQGQDPGLDQMMKVIHLFYCFH